MADFYELFNKIDGKAESYEKTELNDFDKARMMKKAQHITKSSRTRKVRKLAASCAVFLLIGVTAACMNENVQAAVKYFSSQLLEHFGGRKEVQEYISTVNSSQEYNDYKVTFEEATLDSEYLTLAFVIEGKERIEGGEGVDIGKSSIFINGQEMTGDYEAESMMPDPYHTQIILKFQQRDLYREDSVELAIKIYELQKPDESWTAGDNGTESMCKMTSIKGDWRFQYKLDTKSIAQKTEIVNINQKIETEEGMSIDIKQLKASPLDLNVITKEVWKDTEDKFYIFEIEGTDDKGNEMSFDMSGSNKECVYHLSSYNGSLDSCKSITLKVYLITSYKDENKKNTRKMLGKPIVVNLSEQ